VPLLKSDKRRAWGYARLWRFCCRCSV